MHRMNLGGDDSAYTDAASLLYSARAATNHAPHAETPGVQVRAYERINIGFANIGLVAMSDPQDWPSWDPAGADTILEQMGWTRVDDWVSRGGTWFATVVPRVADRRSHTTLAVMAGW